MSQGCLRTKNCLQSHCTNACKMSVGITPSQARKAYIRQTLVKYGHCNDRIQSSLLSNLILSKIIIIYQTHTHITTPESNLLLYLIKTLVMIIINQTETQEIHINYTNQKVYIRQNNAITSQSTPRPFSNI